MYVAPANAVPRAGVETSEQVAAGASAVGVAVVAGALAVVGASAVGAAVAAVEAGGGDAGMVFIHPCSLAEEALRRKCRCFVAPEILLASHRSGAGTL
jgi:hypothetical protein